MDHAPLSGQLPMARHSTLNHQPSYHLLTGTHSTCISSGRLYMDEGGVAHILQWKTTYGPGYYVV